MMFFGGGMFIFWLLLLVILIAVVRGLGGVFNCEQQTTTNTPQEILRERYARGEISQEEYQQMQATLKQ